MSHQMLTTALVVGVVVGTGLVLRTIGSAFIRQQREKPIGWAAASGQHRVIAGGAGAISAGAWLGMVIYVAPSLIPAIRGHRLPW